MHALFLLGLLLSAVLLSVGAIRLHRAYRRRETLEVLRMYRETGLLAEARREANAARHRQEQARSAA
jgi:hypothetical protein